MAVFMLTHLMREHESFPTGDPAVPLDHSSTYLFLLAGAREGGNTETLTRAARRVPRTRQDKSVTLGCLLRWITSGVIGPNGQRVRLEGQVRHLVLAVGCDKNRATWSGVRGIASPIGRGTDPKAAIGYQELSEMKWVRGECRETDAELEMDISEVRCTMLV